MREHTITCCPLCSSNEEDRLLELAAVVPDYDIKARFEHFNAMLFNNEIPEIPLSWSTSKKSAGEVRFQTRSPQRTYVPGSAQLFLSKFFKRTPEGLDAILIHEMIHAYLITVKGDVEDNHGPRFIALAKQCEARVGFAIPLTEKGGEVAGDAKELAVCTFTCGDGRVRYQLYSPEFFRKNEEKIALGLQNICHYGIGGAKSGAVYLIKSDLWTNMAARVKVKRKVDSAFYALSDAALKSDLEENGKLVLVVPPRNK